MFGLGVPELIVILVVVLFIFGPRKLPELGTFLGRSLKDFREAIDQNQDLPDSDPPSDPPSDPLSGSTASDTVTARESTIDAEEQIPKTDPPPAGKPDS